MGNEKIDQINSFTYIGSIISKDGGSSEDVESRIAKDPRCFILQLKKGWKNRKISLQTNIRISEAIGMLTYSYEAWAFRKTK